MAKSSKPNWGRASFEIQHGTDKPFTITTKGRDRWALECLMAVGMKGCTPIDTPGPRWSGYVHKLRTAGVQIETVTEQHEGPFSGTHARYVLRSNVTRVQEVSA